MGFSAYGVTQGDDPVSAMKGLIDNAAGHEHQIALLGGDREAVGARANCRPPNACRRKRTTEQFDAERLNRLVEECRRGGQVGSPSSAGTPCTPPRRSRGRGRRSGPRSAGTAAKMPGTGGVALRQAFQRSAIDFGRPGRLMMSDLPRITATWRLRIAVGTKARPIWRICSPKPGITLSATASVASASRRGAGPVPPVVSTSAQPASTSSTSVPLIVAWSSGMSRSSNAIGFFSAFASQSFSAGRPLVLVDAAAGAVAHRDDADLDGVVGPMVAFPSGSWGGVRGRRASRR